MIFFTEASLRRAIRSFVAHYHRERISPAAGGSSESGVRIVIGEENEADELRNCTVVFAPYGADPQMTGFMGVLGPTRMLYERSVASVGYMTDLLQEMMERVYGY